MGIRILVFTAAAVLLGARPASAQRIDLSGSISFVGFVWEGRTPLTAGPGVTLHFTDKHALQLMTDLHYESRPPRKSVDAIYSLQYRYTFARRNPTWLGFVTVGGGGAAAWSHVEATTYTQTRDYVNGKWVEIDPRTNTHPANTRSDFFPPVIPPVGGGAEYRVSRRLALRGDVTFAIGAEAAIAVRTAVGGVVRFGSPPTSK